MANKWLNALIVFLVLLVFGWARMGYEQALSVEMRQQKLLPASMSLSSRAELKQKGLAATFGSLRPTLAAIMSVTSTQYHLSREWDELEQQYQDIVLLDPGNVNYWDLGSWHIGTNASVSSKENIDLPPLEREIRFNEYLNRGSAFLDQGIEMNPQEWRLPLLKARMWSNPHLKPDLPLVVSTLEKALEYPGIPQRERDRMERMIFYALFKMPGQSQQAYDQAYKLWQEGDRQHFPSVLSRLYVLQNNPSVHIKERLSLEDIYGSKKSAYKNLRNFWIGKADSDVSYGVESALRTLEEELGVRNDMRLFPNGPLK